MAYPVFYPFKTRHYQATSITSGATASAPVVARAERLEIGPDGVPVGADDKTGAAPPVRPRDRRQRKLKPAITRHQVFKRHRRTVRCGRAGSRDRR